jgi:hypothetical protein
MRVGTSGRGVYIRKQCRRVNMVKILCIFMYENRKMRPVEKRNTQSKRKRKKERKKAQDWILALFVPFARYPCTVNNQNNRTQ